MADDGGEGGEETLACGDLVELHSLVASEMNGRKGRLLEWQEASGRWSCLLLGQPQGSRKRSRKGERQEKGSLVNVKPCNLKRIGRVRAANKKQRRGIPEPQTRAGTSAAVQTATRIHHALLDTFCQEMTMEAVALRTFVLSSFLFLVVRPGATSGVLACPRS